MITTNAELVRKDSSPDGQVAFLRFAPEQPLDFVEGQFVMISSPDCLDKHGKIIKRAYSIGTTRVDMDQDGTIGTIVKQSSAYGMSAFLTQEIQLGDSVELNGPAGHFVEHQPTDGYLFVSIGSGVTPVYAHYKRVLAGGRQIKVANLFGERHASSLLDEVVTSFGRQDAHTKNICFLSQEKDNKLPTGRRKGRIQAGLDEALAFLVGTDVVAFLCGKPGMVDEVRTWLYQHGLDKEQVRFEKY